MRWIPVLFLAVACDARMAEDTEDFARIHRQYLTRLNFEAKGPGVI